MHHIYILWTLLVIILNKNVQGTITGTTATFLNVFDTIPDFQKGLVNSLSDRDVRMLASTNFMIRQWTQTNFLLNLRIEKYLNDLITFDDKQLDKLEKLTTLAVYFTESCLASKASGEKKFDTYSLTGNIGQYHNLEKLYHDLVWLRKHRMSFHRARQTTGNEDAYKLKFLTGYRGSDRSKFFIRQTKLQLYLGVLSKDQYNARMKLIQSRFLTSTKFSSTKLFFESLGVLCAFWSTWQITNLWLRILVNTVNINLVIVLVIVEMLLWTKYVHFSNMDTLYIVA